MFKHTILGRFSEEDLKEALCRKRMQARLKGDIFDCYPYEDCKDIIRKADQAGREEMFRRFFNKAVTKIQHDVNTSASTLQERLMLFQSFRKVVSMDLAFSNISEFTCRSSRQNLKCLLPSSYYDEMGKREISYEKKEVELSDKYIVEIPYNSGKWLHYLKHKSLNPDMFKGEDLPRFYPDLDLIFQGNGNIHKTAEAFVNRKEGKGLVMQYNIRPLFEHVSTDGADWLSNGKYIDTVGDYRLALIFWIKQKELEVEKAKSLQK